MKTRIYQKKRNWFGWMTIPVELLALFFLVPFGIEWWVALLIIFTPAYINYMDGLWRGFHLGIKKPDEYILCAAIWFDDGIDHANQPKNIKSGLVLCGHRHGCVFPQIGGLVKERQELGIFEKEQGFLTNLNRFVDREEGLIIALRANQVKDIDDIRGNRLFSEDLY